MCNVDECRTTLYTYTMSDERKIEWGGDPNASAQCNVDIEHTRLVREAAKCTLRKQNRQPVRRQSLIPTTSIYLRSMTIVDGCIIFIFGKDRYCPLLGSIVAHMPSK